MLQFTGIILGLSILIYIWFKNKISFKKIPKDVLDYKATNKFCKAMSIGQNIGLPILMIIERISCLFRGKQEHINLKLLKVMRKEYGSTSNTDIDDEISVERVKYAGVECYVFKSKNDDEDNNKKNPVIIYYHGGGWCIGSAKRTHFSTCRTLAKHSGLNVISIEYSLAPEFPFSENQKCAFFDCYTATRAFINANKIDKYVLSGDSAGGNLCTAVATKLSEEPDKIYAKPTLIAYIYPVHGGMNFTTPSIQKYDYPYLCYWFCALFKLCYLGGKIPYSVVQELMLEPKSYFYWQKDEIAMTYVQNFDGVADPFLGDTYEHRYLESPVTERISKYVINKYASPHYLNNSDFNRLMDFVEKGFICLWSEYDALHDDVVHWEKRLKETNEERVNNENKSSKLIDFTMVKALHGYVTYACDLPKKFPGQYKTVVDFSEKIGRIMKE